MKLKIKKNNTNLSIKLYNEDKSYAITFFSLLQVRVTISYNTDQLILKKGYNQKVIGC